MISPSERAERAEEMTDALETNALNAHLTSRPTKMVAPALSESEHTPLPWAMNEIDPDDKDWGACEITAGDDMVASHVIGLGNAALIVRAVNNHAALARAVSDLIDWLDDGNRQLSESCAADVAAARAALAACEAVSGEQKPNGKEVLPSGDAR